MKYVIGLDYGTDSCRAVLINTDNGKELDHAVFDYPRWKQGMYCDPSHQQYRQHPLDYIEGLEYTIKKVIAEQPQEIIDQIVGIGVDTTGSTPVPVNKSGVPLALLDEFANNPNAMFVLWKDHTAIKEAEEINHLCKTWGGVDYTKYSGGVYSSEWYFSKILKVLREDEEVRKNAYSFVEHADFIPALLTGVKEVNHIKRSRCAAGHKAMWHKEWDGLPSQSFLSELDPLLNGIRERLYEETYTAEVAAGTLCKEWAEKLGLSENVYVSVGAIDAHVGAVGAYIRPGAMVKVMGTSTCDIVVDEKFRIGDQLIAGICGQVDGSVIGGLLGMEAGQSAYGDIYAWFKRLLEFPLQFVNETQREDVKRKILVELEHEAQKIDHNDVVAMDWFNGRRTPFANQRLKGAMMGIDLSTTAPMIYRALIEATSFGGKAIIETMKQQGVCIDEVIAIGGVAKKSPLNMQITADVLNMPIKVVKEEQTVALGAAIFASVASGVYPTVDDAQQKMASPIEKVYMPTTQMVQYYEEKYKQYSALGVRIEEITQ